MQMNYEISKQEMMDYLNDRMGTKYEIFEKGSKFQRSPPHSRNPHRLVMTSPKEKQLNSGIIKDSAKKNTLNMGLESEKVYEDLMYTKKASHLLREENIKFRTKILNMEKQIIKYEKIVQELERSGILASINSQQINENILVMTLRKRIQDLNEELNEKQEELVLIRKTAKYTNHQLLEIENKNYFEEFTRLKEIILRFNQRMQQGTMKEKELVRIITSFEKERQSLFDLKQENENLLQNIEYYKEENENLQQKLERIEKENNLIEVKRKCAILQKENLNLKSSLFNYEEKIKELNNIMQTYHKNDKAKFFESVVKEKEQKILTLENHILEQKHLLENERHLTHDLKEQILKVNSHQDVKKKIEKDVALIPKIDNIKKNVEDPKPLPIDKHDLELVLEEMRAHMLKADIELHQIDQIFKDGFQIKEVHNSKGTIDAIDILEKIIAKIPFKIENHEERLKVSKYLTQNSQSNKFNDFANVLKSLLEPYEIIREEQIEDIKTKFSNVLAPLKENIKIILEDESFSNANLKSTTFKTLLIQIDPNLIEYYDFFLREFPFSKDPNILNEKFEEIIKFSLSKNHTKDSLIVKKETDELPKYEPLPQEKNKKEQESNPFEDFEEIKDVEKEIPLKKKSSVFIEKKIKSEGVLKENTEGNENMVRGLTDPKRLDSFEEDLRKMNKINNDNNENDGYDFEGEEILNQNGDDEDEENKRSEKERLEEELNNDFMNKKPIETNEEIEKINESLPSYG